MHKAIACTRCSQMLHQLWLIKPMEHQCILWSVTLIHHTSWNEWELRRRALQVANLKKCKTTSMQTDMSAYRREIETQVYLPKTKTTQTRVERGTNPKRVHTYIAGLRNGINSKSASKYVKSKDGLGSKSKDNCC